MNARARVAGFFIGLAGGAALVAAAASAAIDPPARGHGQSDAPQGSRFAAGHDDALHVADATYHDDAPGPPLAFRGCSWFEHAGFSGRRGDAPAGANLSWVGSPLDNRISAVACREGCRLLASEDINYTGARRTFRGNTGDLGPAWNDRISALRVVCRAEPDRP